MSFYKLALSGLLIGAACAANAETCRSTNDNLPFRQVVLGIEYGGLRCDYGKEFDFTHSYELQGKFAPSSGPWQGASDPFTVYCRGNATTCVFRVKQ